jgi:hypothetical protein
MSDHRIATIERWLEENGVWWDENRICIDSFHGSTEPGNGLAIYARQDLNEDDIGIEYLFLFSLDLFQFFFFKS